MQTVLFNSTIFGPVKSRRLGVSLGVNLMPSDGKLCSFDCLYCEAGFNAQGAGTSGLPSREAVKRQLRAKLEQMVAAGEPLDSITFSGNGEPQRCIRNSRTSCTTCSCCARVTIRKPRSPC